MNVTKLERRIEALEAQSRTSLQSLSDEELRQRILSLKAEMRKVPTQELAQLDSFSGFDENEIGLLFDAVDAYANGQALSGEATAALQKFGFYP